MTSEARAVVLAAAAAVALLGACDREAPSTKSGDGAKKGAGAGPAEPASNAAPADRRPAVVFLGDSLTAGFGLAAEQAFPALLQGEIDRAGLRLRVVNAGRSGDTTAGGKARIDFYLRPEVAPAALVVWLGANDIMRGVPVAEIEANLRAILRRARAFQGGSLTVSLVQMRAFPNLGADYARAFEAIYPRVAEEEGAALIPFPMEGVAGRRELNQPDGIHPTAEGTRMVADELWRALRPRLAAP